MHSIGANHVVDYTREDPLKTAQRYDLILDFACHRSVGDYVRVLADGGAYVMVGGSTGRVLQAVLLGPWISMTRRKKISLLMARPNRDLSSLLELVEAGKVLPVIDRSYPLAEVPEALRHLGEGHARGKVVVLVRDDQARLRPDLL
jgi:NADPH:quinone reductase-like Zn-dependent oxidoreductase